MYKLVKNEIYKLFHKKSTFITLIILFMFVILVNFIYSKMNNVEYYFDDSYYLQDLEAQINAFNKDIDDISIYASLLAEKETQEYIGGKPDWKIEAYYRYINRLVNEYYYTKYVDKDEASAINIRKEIDAKLERLDNNDWRYFVNYDLETLKEEKAILELDKNNQEQNVKDLKVTEYKIYLLEYRLENDVSYETSYLNSAISVLEDSIEGKLNYEAAKTDEEKEIYQYAYANFIKNEYILNEKVDINNDESLQGLLKYFFEEYLFLILVFVVMISGAMVSDEFSKGTIKSLLTMPYKREQILCAKFITIILMIPLVTIFLLISEIIIGGFFFGFASLSIPVVEYNFSMNVLETMHVLKYFVLNFLGHLPMLLLLATLAFSLSTIICSTSFATTITFCGYFAAAIINQVAQMKSMKFLEYFVTTNWDLTYFIFGGTSPFKISMMQSILVCLIYFVIMVVVTFIVFKKKNIKNI